MSNTIEKHIDLKAPIARVWSALTDHKQFSEWFHINLDQPFEPGKSSVGNMTYPGWEHVRVEFMIKDVQPQNYFSYNWHPYATDMSVDYSSETPTLVEFRLEPIADGTRLTVTESGFENIPEHRRAEAFRMNEGGWVGQMENFEEYVAAHP